MGVSGAQRLPAPSSNLLLSFCRLLASCEEIAAGQDKGREDLRQWQTSPTYHHYIETLQEQLADLEDSGRIHPDTLDNYRKRIGSLSSLLKRAEVSDLCRLLAPLLSSSPPAGGAAGAAPSAPNTSKETAAKPSIRPKPPVAAVTVPKPTPTANKDGKTTIAPPPALKPIALSAAAKSKLNTQGRVQEALTDELADLAAAMKTNTLAMEAKVKERGTLLDGTEAALDKSLTQTKAASAKATVAHRRGRRNFCFTFLVLFIIGTLFVGMYVFIRITSITGYRAAKGVVAPKSVDPTSTPLPLDHESDPLETHTEL